MRNVILTGFEPFGNYRYNPTADLAREFDGKSIEGIQVRGIALPCSYYRAHGVLCDAMNEFRPDFVLSTGLASRIPCIRIESLGRNVMKSNYSDVDGLSPEGTQIIVGGKPHYYTNTSPSKLFDLLQRESIPAEISINADTFVCNSLIYLTARKIEHEALPLRFAFMHIPWTENYRDKIFLEPEKQTIDLKTLHRAIVTILQNTQHNI